ncbi:MAG: hypothetical protein B7X11_05435 [Acidobacteria bacterium 37-65-4]|nr:MAG: hypothetical protein B7X11_05435 [Acidobacteria bacterium 37-65-4]
MNLHLEVLGRRSDGYHELRTVFAPVGVWDELVLEPAPATTAAARWCALIKPLPQRYRSFTSVPSVPCITIS